MVELQEKDRLRITVSGTPVGTLGRGQSRIDSVFAYAEDALEENAVSLTMPARLESYTWEQGVPPVFEMNLPEGALRDELTRRFSKAIRGFDDFAMLAIVGPHQLGRVGIASAQDASGRLPETSLADLLVHDGALSGVRGFLCTQRLAVEGQIRWFVRGCRETDQRVCLPAVTQARP